MFEKRSSSCIPCIFSLTLCLPLNSTQVKDYNRREDCYSVWFKLQEVPLPVREQLEQFEDNKRNIAERMQRTETEESLLQGRDVYVYVWVLDLVSFSLSLFPCNSIVEWMKGYYARLIFSLDFSSRQTTYAWRRELYEKPNGMESNLVLKDSRLPIFLSCPSLVTVVSPDSPELFYRQRFWPSLCE